ncbi:MAG TPA: hypothetical protein PKI22_08765 [Hydrogenophilus thermoluteolus]|nr:hypothetical protein [Hydrogenophilus thermoluteolus]
MSIPRAIIKQLTAEVPLCEQRSYSANIAGGGATLSSEVFNLTLAAFLNPFGQADPAEATRIAPGHVLYWFLHYTGAAANITVNVLANAAPGGVLRLLQAPASVAPVVVPPLTATIFRTDMLGAVWDAQVVLVNNGGGATTSMEFAVGFRAR